MAMTWGKPYWSKFYQRSCQKRWTTASKLSTSLKQKPWIHKFLCCHVWKMYCIAQRLHSHTQGTRLKTCIAVKRNTQIYERRWGYIHGSCRENTLDGANAFTALLLRLHVKRRSTKTRQPILTSLNRSVYMSAEVIHVWQTRW